MSAPSSASTPRAFKPVLLGGKHEIDRLAMAPLTRLRNINQTPNDLHVEYYSQRASPRTLLITEGVFIAKRAGGYPFASKLDAEEQIKGWKKVTTGVHSKGGLIYTQLWALGRANCDPPLHDHMDDVKTVGPSAGVGLSDEYPPEELSIDDIQRYIGLYKQAALNADKAGFDGVEVHGANGYLPDQFLQVNSNKRTDAYGGSLENRAKFILEAVGAAVEAIGQERVGVRFSPWGTFQGMGEANPYATFGYVVSKLVETYPRLSYVHFVEPRDWLPGFNVAGREHLDADIVPSNDHFRSIVRGLDPKKIGDDEMFVFPDPSTDRPTLVLTAGGFDGQNTKSHIERTGDVVALGRYFISNPDLPYRIKHDIPLTKYNRDTFYTHGAEGLIDYLFANEQKAEKEKVTEDQS